MTNLEALQEVLNKKNDTKVIKYLIQHVHSSQILGADENVLDAINIIRKDAIKDYHDNNV